jgi:cyclopropane fatty-acyl-phospholipid synthase-like methyltransferase
MSEENKYNDAYELTPNLFGAKPDTVLVDHLHILDERKSILDIGSGQGRHALYLAQRGFEVVALDPSNTASAELQSVVDAENLPVQCVEGTIESYDAAADSFGTLLIFGLIQILTHEAICDLITRVEQLTAPDGIVIITGWTVEDSSLESVRKRGEQIGPNSYRLPNGDVRTYLELNQIVELFAGWDVVYHWEGIGEWHRHGDSEPERHARVEAVFRKSSM